jgi:hypothetical protein
MYEITYWIHSIRAMPKKIPEFWKLPNSSNYTGRCFRFRRTSATILADAGAHHTTSLLRGMMDGNLLMCQKDIQGDSSVRYKL